MAADEPERIKSLLNLVPIADYEMVDAHGRPKVKPVPPEWVAIAIRWAKQEIGIREVARMIGRESSQAYSIMARALAQVVREQVDGLHQ